MQLAKLPHGTYVVGVSGGVDSVVLLDMLVKQQPENRYVVAHFEHGIRGDDSRRDAEFVKQLAAQLRLEHESEGVTLGPGASEAAARTARYNFLRQCRDKWQANAIVLAHHQDDVLETIIINLIRGTGWRGLASLRSHPKLIRPMQEFTKRQVYEYAESQNIQWCEDVTNVDTVYLRNYVRHKLLPRFDAASRQKLLGLGESQERLAQRIPQELEAVMSSQLTREDRRYSMGRYFLIMAPKHVAIECMQYVVKTVRGEGLEKPQAELALIFARAGLPGKTWQPASGVKLTVNRDRLFVMASKS
jgi:tRNA(Ile)-lysidine synthase